jgi:hypothetical protein
LSFSRTAGAPAVFVFARDAPPVASQRFTKISGFTATLNPCHLERSDAARRRAVERSPKSVLHDTASGCSHDACNSRPKTQSDLRRNTLKQCGGSKILWILRLALVSRCSTRAALRMTGNGGIFSPLTDTWSRGVKRAPPASSRRHPNATRHQVLIGGLRPARCRCDRIV